ncbi:META domain-containing protein [Nocardia sp. NPDC049707]|uniref:META domain-containing protein n=1 Tax=Nocardia sp. NPDC049707 TaxID=3154735 RepID=UPI0034303A63
MSATTVRVGVLLAVAAGLVAGCSNDGKQENKPAASPMGRTFVSTGVEGEQIPGGGPMTLTFADGRISANSGCNTVSGTVDLTEGILHVGTLASTLMACPDERNQADSWQDKVLAALPKWRLDNSTLTLTGKEITVTLLDKKVAQPDRPLIGTTWIVSALMTPDAQIRSQTLDDVKPTLTIAADGAVSGNAGCNRMTGHATPSPAANGPDVTFQIGTTEMACAPEIMEIEQAVLKVLDGKTTATIDAQTLILRNTNGFGLTLRAAQP